MQFTFDTKVDTVDDVVHVVGAAYQVALTVAAAEDSAPSPAQTAGRGSRRRGGGSSGRGSKVKASVVRAWAADNGYEVSTRGAISKTVAEAYASAHR